MTTGGEKVVESTDLQTLNFEETVPNREWQIMEKAALVTILEINQQDLKRVT